MTKNLVRRAMEEVFLNAPTGSKFTFRAETVITVIKDDEGNFVVFDNESRYPIGYCVPVGTLYAKFADPVRDEPEDSYPYGDRSGYNRD